MAAKKNKPKKKDKNYTMIIVLHVCSFPEARWFWFMNEVRLTCFPKTIAFISKCFKCDKKLWEIEWLLLGKYSETAAWM